MAGPDLAIGEAANNDEAVRALDAHLRRDGLWAEAGQLCERTAAQRSEWRTSVGWLKSACIRYNRIRDWQAFARCHRKVRELVATDAAPGQKLDAWCPAGLAIVYPHIGRADEALGALSDVARAVGDGWSVYGRFVYNLARALVYREQAMWSEMLAEGQEFIAWGQRLSPDDSANSRVHESIDEAPYLILAGESGLCYCACSMLTEVVIKAEHEMGLGSGVAFSALDVWLFRYRTYAENTVRRADASPSDACLRELASTLRHRLSTCYGKAAVSAYETGQPQIALSHFAESETLRGAIEGEWQLYRVACLLAAGQHALAKQALRGVTGSILTNGRARVVYDRLPEFDQIRDDPDAQQTVAGWKSLQAMG